MAKERKKTEGRPAENNLDKISCTIFEMLPQKINSLKYPYDDDASLHGDEVDNEDELHDNEEVLIFNCYHHLQSFE